MLEELQPGDTLPRREVHERFGGRRRAASDRPTKHLWCCSSPAPAPATDTLAQLPVRTKTKRAMKATLMKYAASQKPTTRNMVL